VCDQIGRSKKDSAKHWAAQGIYGVFLFLCDLSLRPAGLIEESLGVRGANTYLLWAADEGTRRALDDAVDRKGGLLEGGRTVLRFPLQVER
jgi:hypothetical protein